jgi:hypothetical protein
MLPAEALRDLPAVAEIAQRIAEPEAFLAGKPRIAGRAGTGEDALGDARRELLLQLAGRDGEQQHAHAGTAVGRCACVERAIDAGLAAAADHRGGEAGHRDRGLPRPARAVCCDDHGGRAHAEGFGEGVVDADAFDRQRAHGTSQNGSGRPTAWSGTLMKSSDRP